jgi:hypothetical protein
MGNLVASRARVEMIALFSFGQQPDCGETITGSPGAQIRFLVFCCPNARAARGRLPPTRGRFRLRASLLWGFARGLILGIEEIITANTRSDIVQPVIKDLPLPEANSQKIS